MASATPFLSDQEITGTFSFDSSVVMDYDGKETPVTLSDSDDIQDSFELANDDDSKSHHGIEYGVWDGQDEAIVDSYDGSFDRYRFHWNGNSIFRDGSASPNSGNQVLRELTQGLEESENSEALLSNRLDLDEGALTILANASDDILDGLDISPSNDYSPSLRCGSFDESSFRPSSSPRGHARNASEPVMCRMHRDTGLGWLYEPGTEFPKDLRSILRMLLYLESEGDARAEVASHVVRELYRAHRDGTKSRKKLTNDIYSKLAETIGDGFYAVIRASQTHQSARYAALRFEEEEDVYGKQIGVPITPMRPKTSKTAQLPSASMPSVVELAIAFGINAAQNSSVGIVDVASLARSGMEQIDQMSSKERLEFWGKMLQTQELSTM